METYIRSITNEIAREVTPVISRYIHRVKNFSLRRAIKREFTLSPLKQNLLIASIGFYVLMMGALGNADPEVLYVVTGVGAITMVYGAILTLLLVIKGTCIESIKATQLLHRIRLRVARKGSIVRVELNESDKAIGVRLLYVLITICIGFYFFMSL